MCNHENECGMRHQAQRLHKKMEDLTMFKKLLLVGTGSTLVLGLVFGTGAASYVSTTASRLQEQVKGSVPVEFELDRARQMIKNLTPEIRRNMHLIAKEEVEVERMQLQVSKLQNGLNGDQADLLRLKTDLDEGKTTYVYASHSYSRDQVQTDLSSRFTRYKTQDATRVKLESILRAREKGLSAARAKLDGMLSSKRQLEVNVENLEARMKMVEVAQTTSDFQFDDSHLARTKSLLRDIQTRIEVAERLVDSEGYFAEEIQLNQPEVADVSDEVAAYFGMAGTEELVAETQLDETVEVLAKISLEPSIN